MKSNKVINTIQKIYRELPFDIKDITITAGFIAVLLATHAAKELHDDYVERTNDQSKIIQIERVIEVGEDGTAYTVNYYTEQTSPITYTDAVTGETCYAAPAGYSITYNVNGEPVCTRTYMEKDLVAKEVSKKR